MGAKADVANPGIQIVAELAYPCVAECAVVASPHPERGHIAKAFVVRQPGFEADDGLVTELQDFVKGRIAPYKYPREIEWMDALPKTQTGKVQRFRLREREASARRDEDERQP